MLRSTAEIEIQVNFLCFIIAQFCGFEESFGTKFLCLQVYGMKRLQPKMVGALSKESVYFALPFSPKALTALI